MLKLKFQHFDHLMWKANSLQKILMLGKFEGRKRGGWWDEMLDAIFNSMGMSLSKLWEIVKDREAWCAVAHEVSKSRTCLSDWTSTHTELSDTSEHVSIGGRFPKPTILQHQLDVPQFNSILMLSIWRSHKFKKLSSARLPPIFTLEDNYKFQIGTYASG